MAALLINIATFAFISRLCIVLIQIAANTLVPDHDAGVFSPPVLAANITTIDSIIYFCFHGLRRWDAIYFTHIAQHGYTYENCVAFFPLYPMIVSFVSQIFFALGIVQLQQSILLSGILVNSVLFSCTACNLFTLSMELGFHKMTALLATVVFCLNPASIFMTAPYSETMYCFFLILSLLYIKRGAIVLSSLCLAMSILTRSNGLVGIGFILHHVGQNIILNFLSFRKEKMSYTKWKNFVFMTLMNALKVVICLLICISPFLLYQYYIYTLFCNSSANVNIPAYLVSYGQMKGYKMVDDSPSPWCYQRFPLSYSYIQEKHWGVGFLRYYQVKQIPNFLLAAPVVMLSFASCVFFYKLNPEPFHYLGLRKTALRKDRNKCERKMDTLPSEAMVVHVCHLMFLTIFGCCFIHIQVLTRLLFSSCPILYWYIAASLAQNPALMACLQNLPASATHTSTSHQHHKDRHTHREGMEESTSPSRPNYTPHVAHGQGRGNTSSTEPDISPRTVEEDEDGTLSARQTREGGTPPPTQSRSFVLRGGVSSSPNQTGKESVSTIPSIRIPPSSDMQIQSRRSLRLRRSEEGVDTDCICVALPGLRYEFESSNVCAQAVVCVLNSWKELSVGNRAVLYYCVTYLVIGTVMFSNFLPWT